MGIASRTGPVAVEVDGSAEGLRVIDYACQMAQNAGADLLLVRPYSARAATLPLFEPGDVKAHAEAELRDAVARVRRQVGFSVTVGTALREGSRLHVLPQAARLARLLVVGRRRARGPHRLVAAQADLVLASRCACPVVVVPGGWKPSTADRTVYVGVDGTALSAEAAEYAFREASERGGHLVVVHADTAPVRKLDRAGQEVWASNAELSVSETLAGFAERFPEVRVTRLVTGGPVIEALVRSSQHAGLLVLGAHAGLLPRDPVTRRALAAAASPVAVVKHYLTEAERRAERRLERRGGADVAVPTY